MNFPMTGCRNEWVLKAGMVPGCIGYRHWISDYVLED